MLLSSDALGGKPEAHSLELDCDFGLDATFLHGPPSPKPSVSTGWLGRGKGYAGGPEGWTAGAGQSWQGITTQGRLECGGEFLKIEKLLGAFSDLKA
jgi:hypothetical protein